MRIEVMASNGDDLLAEWNATTSAAELRAISQRFQAQRGKGFRAFGARSGQRVDHFDPDLQEDVVFIAPMIGG